MLSCSHTSAGNAAPSTAPLAVFSPSLLVLLAPPSPSCSPGCIPASAFCSVLLCLCSSPKSLPSSDVTHHLPGWAALSEVQRASQTQVSGTELSLFPSWLPTFGRTLGRTNPPTPWVCGARLPLSTASPSPGPDRVQPQGL